MNAQMSAAGVGEPGAELLAKVRELADKDEIHALLIRYCRGVDRCDAELMRSVYHEDARDEHGVFSGVGWEFAEWVPPRLRERFEVTSHTLPNVRIEVCGDRAIAESTVFAYHVPKGKVGQEYEIFVGRYLDRLERRAGEWKILHRLCVNDFSAVVPHAGQMSSHPVYIAGSRAPDDPSYQLPQFLERDSRPTEDASIR